jgi:hypothetical protein
MFPFVCATLYIHHTDSSINLLSSLPADHELRVPHGRVGFPDDSAVLPVQIASRQRTAVVADYHSVRVQHWHQLEDELVPQLLTAMEYDLERRSERSSTATDRRQQHRTLGLGDSVLIAHLRVLNIETEFRGKISTVLNDIF